VAEQKLPTIILDGLGGSSSGADAASLHDPLLHPELYDGVALRRMFAFFVDMILIGAVIIVAFIPLGVITAFIAIPATVIVGIVYDVLTIGGSAGATPGMRLMGVRVITWSGGRPDNIQILLMSALFWAIHGITGWLAAIVAFLNPRWRCAHDFLSGTVVVRRTAA
jgi:uncharacterized RDD family membrane protein YckC